MQPFDYYKPKDLEEAYRFLALPGKTVLPLAGATDFIPAFRDGVLKADAVVDIKDLPGLREIEEIPEGLYIGAAVRMNEIAHSDLVIKGWGVLADAANTVGSEQVRNRATVGGNMCTASPCADTPPALAALDAIAVLKSAAGERKIAITEFFRGVRKTALTKGEIIAGVILPKLDPGSKGAYVKLSRRKGSDLSIVSVAAQAIKRGKGFEWRIVLGAVAPTLIRVPEAEAILAEGHDEDHIAKAAKAALNASKPISDIRSSEKYRRLMVANMTKRAIQQVLAGLV